MHIDALGINDGADAAAPLRGLPPVPFAGFDHAPAKATINEEIGPMKKKALVIQSKIDVDWALLEKTLHELFGVNARAAAKDGRRKTDLDLDASNGICDLIRRHPKGRCRICDLVQKIMSHEAQIRKRYVTEECAAGMYKIVVPVLEEDVLEGFVTVCGRPFINADRVYTHYIHETVDEDEEDIKRLLPTLTPLNPRIVRDIVHFITSYN